ncbi:MAG TPA: GDSL-type esterase/lipase family protein, partial [Myxococcota bacterium]|nr:GDSL-type esterase/lipase family protein [Myxococcota bacterium]
MRTSSLVFVLALVAACGPRTGKDSGAKGGFGGNTGNTGGSGDGGKVPSGPLTEPFGPSAEIGNEGFVRPLGRVVQDSPGGVLLAWPGSGLQVRVNGGSQLVVTLAPQQHGQFNRVGVLVDGKQVQEINPVRYGPFDYPISVPSGDHLVSIVKTTEAANGSVLVSKIVTNGQFDVVPQPGRLIEVVGENAVAGYSANGPANLTSGAGCQKDSFDAPNYVANPNFQNAITAFGAQAAMLLRADWSLVAATGRGLIQNFDNSTGLTLPALWDYADPTNYKSAGAPRKTPDVVVLNVGSNDINHWFYSEPPVAPDTAGFQSAMAAFIKAVHAKYPSAKILVTPGPTLGNSQKLANGQGLLQATVSMLQAAVQAAGVAEATFYQLPTASSFSCDYYPDAAAHGVLAQALATQIAKVTGWKVEPGPAGLPEASPANYGPKTLTKDFPTLPDPLKGAGDPNVTGITLKEFPQCHICSPRPHATVPECPAVVGQPDPCLGYCHVPDTSDEPYASNPPASGNHYA